MNNRVVLITGAKGGLGTFITQKFLSEGATVLGASRHISQQDFPAPNFTALAVDFSNPAEVRSAVESAVRQFGSLHVLVHVVGGFAGGPSVAETDDATWQRMFDLNLHSAFQLLRAAIPHMRRAASGRIVAIGSRAALDPGPGLAAYNASKAALVSLVRTVALENKDAGITANVILPGTMDTPANRASDPRADFSRWVRPATVASLIVWLAGDQARDVTGAVIPVYGAGL